MKKGISKKIIKPENCVLAFGIPTTKEAFSKDQTHDNKDFAKRFIGVLARYDYEIVSNIKKIDPTVSKSDTSSKAGGLKYWSPSKGLTFIQIFIFYRNDLWFNFFANHILLKLVIFYTYSSKTITNNIFLLGSKTSYSPN
jgi:hypothetical protein